MNYDAQYIIAMQRQEEMLAAAERQRLVRLARGPRPLRRRLGQLLIAAGEALARQPLDVVISESG